MQVMGDSLMFMRQPKYILSKLIKAITIVIKLLSKYAECTKDFNNSQNYFCAVVLKYSIRIGRNSKLLRDCNGISTNMYIASRFRPNESFIIDVTMMNTKVIDKV